MDIQLKRGLLEPCVLSLLKRGDSYGYQLLRDLSVAIEISESTLYPILKRLEQTGSLYVYSVEHNGRLRKYYRITQKGQEGLEGFGKDLRELRAVLSFIEAGLKGAQHDAV